MCLATALSNLTFKPHVVVEGYLENGRFHMSEEEQKEVGTESIGEQASTVPGEAADVETPLRWAGNSVSNVSSVSIFTTTSSDVRDRDETQDAGEHQQQAGGESGDQEAGGGSGDQEGGGGSGDQKAGGGSGADVAEVQSREPGEKEGAGVSAADLEQETAEDASVQVCTITQSRASWVHMMICIYNYIYRELGEKSSH